MENRMLKNLMKSTMAVAFTLGMTMCVGAFIGMPITQTVYAHGNKVYEIKEPSDVVVFSDDDESLDKYSCILITSEDPVTIHLKNWDRSVKRNCEYSPITIDTDADVTITYEGSNKLSSYDADGYPGIDKGDEDGTLTIKASDNKAALTVFGGRNAAGIGTKKGDDCENIYIKGGRLRVSAEDRGAAIGAGSSADAYNITIDNSYIIAEGGIEAAAIGSGYCKFDGEAEGIKIINHSTIKACHSTQGLNTSGACIGGGKNCDVDGITITDSTVKCLDHGTGAGIGGGEDGDAENITIINSTIETQDCDYHFVYGENFDCDSPGIGGGKDGDAENIKIHNSIIDVQTGDKAACIGGGSDSVGENFDIADSVLYLENNSNNPGDGIGSGYNEEIEGSFKLENCVIDYTNYNGDIACDNQNSHYSSNLFIKGTNLKNSSGAVTICNDYKTLKSGDITIPKGFTLNVKEGVTFTIKGDLVNQGILNLYDSDSVRFIDNHSITGDGTVTYVNAPAAAEEPAAEDNGGASSSSDAEDSGLASGDAEAKGDDSSTNTASVFNTGSLVAVIAIVLAAVVAVLGIVVYRKKRP